MRQLLQVEFSAGVAAVLLGAAAIILIVMVAEAVCALLSRKPKKSVAQKPCENYIEEIPQEKPAEDKSPVIEEVTEQPLRETPPEREKIILSEGEKMVYDKSFLSRLILSDEGIKKSYSALKNELLKSGFKSRVCWRYESFRAQKPPVAKLAIRAGGLCLFCALDPEDYPDVRDLSGKKTYKRTPLLCEANGGGEEPIARRLICDLAEKYQTESGDFSDCDYSALLPYEDIESLLDKGLIKIKIYRKKPRAKRKKITEEKEEKIIVKTKIKPVKKGYKKGVKKAINLEAVFACFEEGEEATFEEIILRVFGGKKNIVYLKILGRGKADKKLTVTANSFSRSAEKSILDAGGKIIRKRP